MPLAGIRPDRRSARTSSASSGATPGGALRARRSWRTTVRTSRIARKATTGHFSVELAELLAPP
jgi:hypothetical protein